MFKPCKTLPNKYGPPAPLLKSSSSAAWNVDRMSSTGRTSKLAFMVQLPSAYIQVSLRCLVVLSYHSCARARPAQLRCSRLLCLLMPRRYRLGARVGHGMLGPRAPTCSKSRYGVFRTNYAISSKAC